MMVNAAANIMVGPPVTTEGLEIVILPGEGCSVRFDVPTVLAVNMGLSDVVEVRGSAGWAIAVGGWIRGA
ncbi:hypothetical protein B0H34DRAFT_726423, partial [Crassisporium funariophilum]